ncbi:MAG: ATP-binding cassette domain-containing protein [Phycisphaerae bacterium]
MDKTHISVQNLSIYYDGQPGLRNISVDIPDKKITAIIGPSGCGKSTLLKSFNRLLDEQDKMKIKGTVLVDGEDIYDGKVDVTQIRKKMGLLSQRPQVLPMSIYDNVAYGPRIHNQKDKHKLDKIVQEHLENAGLWEEVKSRLHSPASKLSIGQQQRLCLARGLAVNPEVILGDEPTSALDPISAETIERRFLELKKDYTIVLVTHILRQAKRLADYVVFLYMGHLIEHGPADEFFNKPKYEKTQAYINGQFIVEHAIDRELDLRGTRCPENFDRVRSTLEEMPAEDILKLIVDYEAAINIFAREVDRAGHRVLEATRIGKASWEIVIKKEKPIISFQI